MWPKRANVCAEVRTEARQQEEAVEGMQHLPRQFQAHQVYTRMVRTALEGLLQVAT